ncbi:hypothetical protein ACFPER_09860 [Agromyces aurantiacus]|uniref:Secreted protein n=1 Tax=Agromyces aurantiacus TaxID=165814 RepID=A0ABV9R663_9MICO|nr:hypothetical protein [Agromyces aurantiacus]MBM7503779.1 hypothetical protein [Agromyces aurantiacus]
MRSRARTIRLGAIAAALGLALAGLAAAAPASAATYTCASFSGLTVTADTVSRSPVSLNAGDVIRATVSPARDGDVIILSAAAGTSINFVEAPATTGLSWKAPVTGSYGLGWSLEASGTRPSSLTWSFTCTPASGSTATVSDSDRDGVANSSDACASTTLPDSTKKPVAGRYAAKSTGRFLDGTGAYSGYTVVDTGGCSALQIAKALNLGRTDLQSGITLTTLKNWAATH